MADISKFLDKAYEGKDFSELADAPVDALEGVSQGDAEHLKDAFNIKTIRDLAESKFVLRAQAITHLSR
ncbi:MAG: hypothetical protein JO179_11995 [Solirubrobacterales bacterium]|nr:hypothetical protein [Solirubrobacterales bacterium]